MRVSIWTTSALFAISGFAQLDGSYNWFESPGSANDESGYASNQLAHVGSKQTISWETTLDSYAIVLWQQWPDNGGASIVSEVYSTEDGAGTQSFQWTVEPGNSSVQHFPVYLYWLTSSTNSSLSMTSHYFNMTYAPVPSTSTTTSVPTSSILAHLPKSASSKTSKTSTASSTTSKTSAGASSTSSRSSSSTNHPARGHAAGAQTTAKATSSPSSSTTLDVGLGIGVGVGIALALIGGFWLGLRRAQKRRQSRYNPSHVLPSEMDGRGKASEMMNDDFAVVYNEKWHDFDRPELGANRRSILGELDASHGSWAS